MSLREVRGVPPPKWIRDKKTDRVITSNLENIREALKFLKIRVTYDAFARELRLNGAAVVDDLAFEKIWVRITDRCGWQPNRRNLQAVITCDAEEHATHPVKDYLNRLVWDGVARLDTWLITYAEAPANDYVRGVSPLPLLAAVQRIYAPGTKFDELLTLESTQGTGKSSALRALCPCDDWFSDDLPLGVDAKVVIERTAGKWIIEAAEMVGNRGKETDNLKAFLSRGTDGPVRQAYGRLSVSVPRQFVMIATTNHGGHYLKDMTGARRFWPVTIKQFNVEALRRDRDQLWAEAVARAPTASLHLKQSLWADAAEEQEARRATDPWEDVLDAKIPRKTDASGEIHWVTSIACQFVWAEILGVPVGVRLQHHEDRLFAIMDRWGYMVRRRKVGMCWVLKDPKAPKKDLTKADQEDLEANEAPKEP